MSTYILTSMFHNGFNAQTAEVFRQKISKRNKFAFIASEFEKAPEKYDFLKASKNLNIIYEDENIILCDKKVGVLSHPDDNEYIDTLIGRIKRYLYENGEYTTDIELSPLYLRLPQAERERLEKENNSTL